MEKLSRIKTAVDVAASVAMLLAASFVIWSLIGRTVQSPPPNRSLPAGPISLADAHVKGSRAAQVAILQYSDFECPFCGQYTREEEEEVVKGLVDTGVALYAFKHFPLERIHRRAKAAAVAAVCADMRGSFWKMHAALFGIRGPLELSEIDAVAGTLGLRSAEFHDCLGGPEARKVVEGHVAEAIAVGVVSTPTFFVGRVRRDNRLMVAEVLRGVQSASALAAAVGRLQ